MNLSLAHADDTGSNTPVLKLDTGGHMNIIQQVIAMKDGRHIITVSYDKTICIWDAATGRQTGYWGRLVTGSKAWYSQCVSQPDEHYLAVGGYLARGHGVNEDLVGAVRVYDITSGKLQEA